MFPWFCTWCIKHGSYPQVNVALCCDETFGTYVTYVSKEIHQLMALQHQKLLIGFKNIV